MNRLSRLLIIMIALILAVPLAVPTAPTAQAQDGSPLRSQDGADFWVPLTPLESENIESVIAPKDSRIRITNTTSTNYRWVVKLEMLYGSDLYLCSGWLIGPRLVATAGHCVYNGGWADAIRVIPAQNQTNEPYGSQLAYDWGAPSEWITGPDPDYDFGFVVLPDMTMGSLVGVYQNVAWLSSWFQDHDLKSQVNVTGYPGDKLVNGNTAWTMWTDKDPLVKDAIYYNEKLANYAVDTYGGESGSAVWSDYAGNKFALAVHAYGVGPSPCYSSPAVGVTNCGPRIDDAWLDYLNDVILFFYPDAVPAGAFYTDMDPASAPVLLTPPDGLLTNQKILFSWNAHPGAIKYELWIDKWDLFTGAYKGAIHKKTTSTQWNKSLPTGSYRWWVRIYQPDKFPGVWSYGGAFYVDKKKPTRPALVWPPKNTLVTVPFDIEWSPLPDLDIDYFLLQTNPKNSGWNNVMAVPVSGTGVHVTSATEGVWYWRVSAVDFAGNQGPWSPAWKLIVGPTTSIAIGAEPFMTFEGAAAPPATQTANPFAVISIGEGAHSSPPTDNYRGTGVSAPVLSTGEAGVPVIPID